MIWFHSNPTFGRVAVSVISVALLTAGCRAAGTPTPAAGPVTVGTKGTGLGMILVDGQGRTLYLFEKDEAKESYCTGACAAIWPPLTSTASPIAGDRANASLLGTIRRDDGARQVTYHGHPLYYYVADNSTPGSLRGQDLKQFGASWYVLTPDGDKAEKAGGDKS
jgi:predicted lipoprotein with Yx(FWY)xxD motif